MEELRCKPTGAASSSVHSLDTIRGPSFSSTQSSEWGSNAKTRNATTRSNCQNSNPTYCTRQVSSRCVRSVNAAIFRHARLECQGKTFVPHQERPWGCGWRHLPNRGEDRKPPSARLDSKETRGTAKREKRKTENPPIHVCLGHLHACLHFSSDVATFFLLACVREGVLVAVAMLEEGRKAGRIFGLQERERERSERCGMPAGACIATSQIHVRSKSNDCSIELVECNICFTPFLQSRVCLRVEGGGIRCKKDLNTGRVCYWRSPPFSNLRNRARWNTTNSNPHNRPDAHTSCIFRSSQQAAKSHLMY
jgi:hypothetical protein